MWALDILNLAWPSLVRPFKSYAFLFYLFLCSRNLSSFVLNKVHPHSFTFQQLLVLEESVNMTE